jgi:tetratricopeptide (TPR) repeat protein
MKPAGLVVIIPFVAALSIALYQNRNRWWLFLPVIFIFVLGFIFFYLGGVSPRFPNLGSLLSFLLENRSGILRGLINSVSLLDQWLGLPYLLLALTGIGCALWRRNSGDFVLLIFLITALSVTASYLWLDERFLVYLLPAIAVLAGRVLAEGRQIFAQRKIIKAFITLIVIGLTSQALINSAWQGILFSLPDTRAVAGRWFEAHFPKTVRMAMEEYYPLGVNTWPRASFFDPLRPLPEEADKADLLVTSSLMHHRFLADPERYHRETSFFTSLQKEKKLIKKFSLGPIGFIQPDIGVYSPLSAGPRTPLPFLPRPYDKKWNFGLSFLDTGPFDRDDRTFMLGWGQRYRASLVSPLTGQDMVVFILNGPEQSLIRIKVGRQVKIRTLKPGEFHILTFRPKWLFPKRPALYLFEAGLPQGKKVLVQLRWGNREIGQAFVKWGEPEKAVPYLKKAVAGDDPYKAELLLLLASVYKSLEMIKEAGRTISPLVKGYPDFIDMVQSLGSQGQSSNQKWEQDFRKMTGLDPVLLTQALSQEFNSEEFSPSRSGQVKENCLAAGGQSIVYEKTTGKPDEVMFGPFIYLDPGAYFAGFFLRTWDVHGEEPFAVIKVLADDKVISIKPVKPGDLDNSGGYFREVKIPFEDPNPRAEIKFQVFATGQASFAVDKIRIWPDLRRLFEEKLSVLKSFAGTLP